MSERHTERQGSLIESHKGYDLRLLSFYPLIAILLLTLGGGLAYQQLFKSDIYHQRESQQNQRRILMPGPRGNIYDREGRILVENRARFSVTINLDELRGEFLKEERVIRKNYRELGDKDLPNRAQIRQIARVSVLQNNLDKINRALGRDEKIDVKDLNNHFAHELLLPFTLIDDLKPTEYARLLEQLDVRSAMQVHASSMRYYPYGSAASHTLGYVSLNNDVQISSDFPGANLDTSTLPGTIGTTGLEKRFDALLQGQTGGAIYRVDPSGYRINPPLQKRVPIQGQNLTTSLDIDIQLAAEKAISEMELKGAAVMLDVATGEVLCLANKPDYDLNELSPRISNATFQKIEESGGWYFRAIQGVYAPGSTFKILTALAGMHAGTITPETPIDCPGYFMVGNKSFPCHANHAHGHIFVPTAIAKSCNVFFFKYGLETSVDLIAKEARRFHLDRPTGIELPGETKRMLIPDPEWKRKARNQSWFPGDTANMSIGQGDVGVTPLQMACFVASVARGQTTTPPTLLHDAKRPPLNTEPIGLPPASYAALRQGMEQCMQPGGTGARFFNEKLFPKLEGLTAAGKSGTAQKRTEKGTLNFAWFICYAPADKPEVALAVMMEGDTLDEETGGGIFAVPIAHAMMKTWWEKKNRAPSLIKFPAPPSN